MRERLARAGYLWLALGGMAALVVVAGLALWLVPPMLDWNRYRGEIEALVSANLGREVAIEGPISLSLLPEPILAAARISVAGDTGANPHEMSLTVAELRVRLALIPLLSGRVDAQELVLRGVDIHLPWPLGPDTLALRPPTWLSSISARIEEGRLSIGTVAVTHINATLGLAPDTGSSTAGGTAEISGQTWHITTRLTRSGRDGAAGLDLSLDGQGPVQGLGAMFAGQVAPDGTVSGRLSGRGPDLSRLLAAPAVAFKADGRFSIAGGMAIADDLAVDIAGSPARGAIALRFAPALRLDVSLAISRLDLDAWLPALLRPNQGRIVASIPTGIDLSSEAATLAGGTLRALRGSFEIGADTLSMRDVRAILPGEAQLELAGEVRRTAAPAPAPAPGAASGASGKTPDPTLSFDGHAGVAAPNLRVTLGWLEAAGLGSLATVPGGVLRTADLRATIAADLAPRPRVVLTEIRGLLDSSHVQGALTIRPAARLGLAGALAFDTVALDPWLAAATGPLAGLPQRLGRFDLDLQLKADRATLRGQALAPAVMDVLLEPGRLALRKLELQSGSTKLSAAAIVNDQGRITDGRLDLAVATDTVAGALAPWLAGIGPADAIAAVLAHLPRGPLTLAMQAAGPPEALALRANADLGDLHMDAQPVLDLATGKWTAGLTLRHPGAPRLLDGIGLAGTASWLGDGSLSWAGTLAGTGPIWAPARLSSDGFDIAAGSLRANGSFVLDAATAPPSLTARINAETLPLPWPYPRSPDPLPQGLLAGWKASLKIDAGLVLVGQSPALQKASATLSLAGGVLRLEGLRARLEGGDLTGAMLLDTSASVPTFSADIGLAAATPAGPVFDLPLDISGGTLDANATLSARGHSPAALLSTLSGALRLNARSGTLIGVDLGRIDPKMDDVALKSALVGGTTPYTQFDLQASLTNGAARITGSAIATASGTASLAGLVDITGMTSELRLAIKPAVPDPPDIALRLSGPFAATRRTAEIADAIRWRAEHSHVGP